MSTITGSLLLESAAGEHLTSTARQARDLARNLPLVSVTFRHNDTDVRAFADDTVSAVTRRWTAARGEHR